MGSVGGDFVLLALWTPRSSPTTDSTKNGRCVRDVTDRFQNMWLWLPPAWQSCFLQLIKDVIIWVLKQATCSGTYLSFKAAVLLIIITLSSVLKFYVHHKILFFGANHYEEAIPCLQHAAKVFCLSRITWVILDKLHFTATEVSAWYQACCD